MNRDELNALLKNVRWVQAGKLVVPEGTSRRKTLPEHSLLKGVKVALGLKEVIGTSPSLDYIDERIRMFDWRVLIRYISRLSVVENHPPLSIGQINYALVRAFIRPDHRNTVIELLRDGQHEFLNTFQLAALVGRVLEIGVERSQLPSGTTLYTFGELLLAANDLLGYKVAEDSTEEQLLSGILRLAGFSWREEPGYLIARYSHLLLDVAGRLRDHPQWRDVRADYFKATGNDLLTAIAIGFGFVSNYFDAKTEGLANLQHTMTHKAFDVEPNKFFGKAPVAPDQVNRIVAAWSTNPHSAKKTDGTEFQPYNMRRLRETPLIDLGNNRFVPGIMRFVFDKLGEGLYWDVVNGLDADERDEFTSFLGIIVEQYVYALLTRVYGSSGSSHSRWFVPSQYQRRRSVPEGPDAVIVGTGKRGLELAFLEIKSSRPHLTTIADGDLKAFDSDINEVFIESKKKPKAAAQLDRAIRDFYNGDWSLPRISNKQVSRVYPIVVTLSPWPLFIGLYERLRGRIADAGLLRDGRTAPLEVWSCYDLELLEPLITNGLELTRFLDAKLKGPANNLPVSYLINNRITVGGQDLKHLQNVFIENLWEGVFQRITPLLGLGKLPENG